MLFASVESLAQAQDAATEPWWDEWEVADGFRLDTDTSGYDFPVAIAFVPSPGKGPGAPLYYVLELRGKLKVVTRDRKVHDFAADITNFLPSRELPLREGEAGSAGLCLDPVNGYVFVTFLYKKGSELKNAMVRFQAEPRTFGLVPKGSVTFESIFSDHPSAISHQIGPCQVVDGQLFVSVGDAEQPKLALDPSSPNGKILRMDLDGRPLGDNPFFTDRNPKKASNYVWASGFRNPFGLAVARDRLFAADNGPSVDRFVEVNRGESYLYDGSDWSIGSKAAVTFAPAVSPVTLAPYPASSELFPVPFRDRFFVALSGSPTDRPGPGRNGQKSIVMLKYDFEKAGMSSVPEHFFALSRSGEAGPGFPRVRARRPVFCAALARRHRRFASHSSQP